MTSETTGTPPMVNLTNVTARPPIRGTRWFGSAGLSPLGEWHRSPGSTSCGQVSDGVIPVVAHGVTLVGLQDRLRPVAVRSFRGMDGDE